MDLSIIHICMYKNRFNSRPEVVENLALELGSIQDENGFGMGHIPISLKEFCSWQPKLLVQGSVSKAELEGYEIWKKSQGGIF